MAAEAPEDANRLPMQGDSPVLVNSRDSDTRPSSRVRLDFGHYCLTNIDLTMCIEVKNPLLSVNLPHATTSQTETLIAPTTVDQIAATTVPHAAASQTETPIAPTTVDQTATMMVMDQTSTTMEVDETVATVEQTPTTIAMEQLTAMQQIITEIGHGPQRNSPHNEPDFNSTDSISARSN